MWQALYSELRDPNFMIVAVAMDSRPDAARPWIEKAQPDYLCLIDQDHLLSDLYNMVNVPQAVWIDEAGRIVRPTEIAGAYESFRWRDQKTGEVPPAENARKAQAQASYVAAVRDWVQKGANSEFSFSAEQARAHVPEPSEDVMQAHVAFRLGQALLRRGRTAEAEVHFAEAKQRHPESWNIWRQCYTPNEAGLAAGPEFWERVQSLGDKHYYPLPDMAGMPQ